MSRLFLSAAALSGFLAVCLGAFAAHGLKQQISAESLALWQTGAQYQIYHALALLAVGVLASSLHKKSLKLSGLAFILGSVLFSGSLYALALGAPHWIGILTPIGGLSFLIGWLALFAAVCRH